MSRPVAALLLLALFPGSCKSTCRDTRPAKVPEVARPRPKPPRSLRLLSYNVLADPVAVEQRIPKLLEIISTQEADIIGLQEVAPWFLARLMRERWAKRYHFAPSNGAPGGQLVLSRFPIASSILRLLPGNQRRTVVVARVKVPGTGEVAVATAHMESFLEDGPIRARQLDTIFALLRPHARAVFLGDFNFGDGEQPETGRLDRSYVDVWRALHEKKPGLTWNIEKSEMARKGSFVNEPSRRLDRILVRLAGYRPRSAAIIGDSPAPGGRPHIFPSDHFGLVAVLVRQ